jgi:hypothetical protein
MSLYRQAETALLRNKQQKKKSHQESNSVHVTRYSLYIAYIALYYHTEQKIYEIRWSGTFFNDILFDPRLTDYTIYKPSGISIFPIALQILLQNKLTFPGTWAGYLMLRTFMVQ